MSYLDSLDLDSDKEEERPKEKASEVMKPVEHVAAAGPVPAAVTEEEEVTEEETETEEEVEENCDDVVTAKLEIKMETPAVASQKEDTVGTVTESEKTNTFIGA